MYRSLARLFRFLLQPIVRFFVPRINVDDPWKPTVFVPPPERFGPGAVHKFPWYFEGQSSVKLETPDQVFAWLEQCSYVDDRELFHEDDFWQHPATFERTRRGDCEDYALWAWRKLTELGVAAEFFVGSYRHDDGSLGGRGHAWVVFEQERERYVLEPASDGRRMVRLLEDVRNRYVPAFSVNSDFQTKSYYGWFVVQAAELGRS